MLNEHAIHPTTSKQRFSDPFRQIVLYIICILFGVMVGGFFASILFRALVLRSLGLGNTIIVGQDIVLYNLLDYLIPYYGFFGGGTLLFALLLVIFLSSWKKVKII
jgi:hypothetical protein